jgi:hypothetical protein
MNLLYTGIASLLNKLALKQHCFTVSDNLPSFPFYECIILFEMSFHYFGHLYPVYEKPLQCMLTA